MQKDKVKIAWFGKHFGEEPPLVGNKDQGAGGIFFSGCHLKCVFCQNHQISHQNIGKEYSIKELSEIMLDLQKQNAINIDLVTPTSWSRQIKEAAEIAKEKGLKIPIVWNSNAYESPAMIKDLEGIVDIYLPDFKYGLAEIGEKYSGIKKYPEIAEKAIREMLHQVGHLKIHDNIAYRGIIVRHLVLPNNLENSKKVLDILANIDNRLFLGLMSQYSPMYDSKDFSEINRQLTQKEWQEITKYLEKLEFTNGWIQDLTSSEIFIPDFTKKDPFKFEHNEK
jgi:putative pyruvate formate lyase activating enzyme